MASGDRYCPAGRAVFNVMGSCRPSLVNRVFNDTPGGQVVDYLGLADQLRQAFAQTVLEQAEVFTGLSAA